jgi:hypothetical protein
MNTKHHFTAILIFATILFTACTPSRYIVYSVNNITIPASLETIPINVDIKTLTDNRANIEENKILFTSQREASINHKTVCINAEKHYNKEPVVNQITQLLFKHINKARLFTNANINDTISSDYYLTGTLNSFYGEQDYSVGAAVGAQFGLIGALATANLKTPGKIMIEISDLKLFRKDGTLVMEFGDFSKEYKDNFPADAYCWCIYETINVKLKDFNAQLIEKIRYELLDVDL